MGNRTRSRSCSSSKSYSSSKSSSKSKSKIKLTPKYYKLFYYGTHKGYKNVYFGKKMIYTRPDEPLVGTTLSHTGSVNVGQSGFHIVPEKHILRALATYPRSTTYHKMNACVLMEVQDQGTERNVSSQKDLISTNKVHIVREITGDEKDRLLTGVYNFSKHRKVHYEKGYIHRN